ncbi:MAG: F0F1 ATP synthase subunit epsilon [Bacteroidales bacterium]|nr:F0F1 ATP synthase subunit epsilon [Bacteroidales bacterium]
MILKVLVPTGTLLEEDVSIVTLPGAMGSFQVLKGHAPLLSPLDRGKIVWKGDNPGSLDISDGFVRVENDLITVCAEL